MTTDILVQSVLAVAHTNTNKDRSTTQRESASAFKTHRHFCTHTHSNIQPPKHLHNTVWSPFCDPSACQAHHWCNGVKQRSFSVCLSICLVGRKSTSRLITALYPISELLLKPKAVSERRSSPAHSITLYNTISFSEKIFPVLRALWINVVQMNCIIWDFSKRQVSDNINNNISSITNNKKLLFYPPYSLGLQSWLQTDLFLWVC